MSPPYAHISTNLYLGRDSSAAAWRAMKFEGKWMVAAGSEVMPPQLSPSSSSSSSTSTLSPLSIRSHGTLDSLLSKEKEEAVIAVSFSS
ncbi:hypothetical protein RB195_003537 [Necator americanus]|uniref:Uncharacterized protein n=1 Tax=Necator americanus TaxID=51031 RepID=A0ABR1DQJ7_NECAM